MKLEQYVKKYLRGLGHKLSPVVTIADQGLKDTVIAATHEALDAHELIKVKVRAEERETRDLLLETLCAQTRAELVTRVGHTALLFRRNHDKPRIDLSLAR